MRGFERYYHFSSLFTSIANAIEQPDNMRLTNGKTYHAAVCGSCGGCFATVHSMLQMVMGGVDVVGAILIMAPAFYKQRTIHIYAS